MADHYFTQTPESVHKPLQIDAEYRGHALRFATDSGVFSRTGVDRGSLELLRALPDGITGRVLDMGCGYGVLGISIKKHNPDCRVTMADINQRAVALAEQNARQNGVTAEVLTSDGFAALAGCTFDWIVLNPPIRAGKAVIYRMFQDAADTLATQGMLWLVIRKQQGAPSAAAALREWFQTVETVAKKGGYWILRCQNEKAER